MLDAALWGRNLLSEQVFFPPVVTAAAAQARHPLACAENSPEITAQPGSVARAARRLGSARLGEGGGDDGGGYEKVRFC